MKSIFSFSFLFLSFISTLSQTSTNTTIEKTFWLGDFRLESGTILPKAYIMYVTYGSLNKDKNNAILLPSWYSADYNGYNFMIGTGKALDTTKYFLILSELFANGHSSSPSNTPTPFNGPPFPMTSIRDNVKATYELITKQFALNRLKAVIGYSMGAQQAFQWALSYPQVVETIVAYCGTAKTYPHGYVRLGSAISTIKAYTAWNNGFYLTPPLKGLRAWTQHWASWFLSQAWYRKELYKQMACPTVDDFLIWCIKSDEVSDANDRIAQAITWEKHDISRIMPFNGDIEKALAGIKCKVLYLPSQTGMYFPMEDAKYERQFIPYKEFVSIPSIWGHIAGAGINPKDNDFLNAKIGSFLSR